METEQEKSIREAQEKAADKAAAETTNQNVAKSTIDQSKISTIKGSEITEFIENIDGNGETIYRATSLKSDKMITSRKHIVDNITDDTVIQILDNGYVSKTGAKCYNVLNVYFGKLTEAERKKRAETEHILKIAGKYGTTIQLNSNKD